MPTIRIDHDVYRWLQNQATAFEDTPNSVLRRVSGLDSEKTDGDSNEASRKKRPRARTASGRTLALREGLTVAKAYYHWDGTWYQRVHDFPVALFDRYGYVVLESRLEYLNHPKISGLEKTNIPDGIASFTNYRKMARPAY